MTELVTLATLVRGKNYKHFFDGEYTEFKRGIPREVSDDIADELEGLFEEIATDDGEKIEQDRFRIERDQKPLEQREEGVTRKRLRIVAETVSVRPVRRPPVALKKAPAGFKPRVLARG